MDAPKEKGFSILSSENVNILFSFLTFATTRESRKCHIHNCYVNMSRYAGLDKRNDYLLPQICRPTFHGRLTQGTLIQNVAVVLQQRKMTSKQRRCPILSLFITCNTK